jgi:hypothetical protein
MKTYSLVAAAALALVASGSVLAEGASYDYPQPISQATSRAAVVADLEAARAAGLVPLTEARLNQDTPNVSTRSRTDVRAETLAAIQAGDIHETTEESNAFTIVVGTAGSATLRR